MDNAGSAIVRTEAPLRGFVLLAACMACAGPAAAAGEPRGESAGDSSAFLSLGELKLLERVRTLYPWRTLGVLRVNGRALLVGSSAFPPGDALRAGRIAPADEPVSLAGAEAAQHGLTQAPDGAVVLAAGRSVYLVDPLAPEVTVEVKASPDGPLRLGDMAARAARPGVLAGLIAPGARPGADAALRDPQGRVLFIVSRGNVGQSAGAAYPGEPAATRLGRDTTRANAPAAGPATAPVAAAIAEETPTAPAPVAPVVPPASSPVAPVAVAAVNREEPAGPASTPAGSAGPEGSYAASLRALQARQGRAWLRSLAGTAPGPETARALRVMGLAP
jgi:hypothetical protein